MDHKEIFYRLLEEHIHKLHKSKQATFVIDTAKYNEILRTLNLKHGEVCPAGATFKYWVFDTFKVVRIGSLDYIYSKNKNLPVARKEELFDILHR